MHEVRPGLWTWTAPHPAWTLDQGGEDGWEQHVRSYGLEVGDRLVLFDPLVGVVEAEALADGRSIVVLLTNFWHRRSSAELVAVLGAEVHAPRAALAEFDFPVQPYDLGHGLPGGVEPQVGAYLAESSLWIRGLDALVTGDTFPSGPSGFRLQPDTWLEEGLTAEGRRERLAPLLELPVELLLPTHGDPVLEDARGTLARALAA